MRAMNSKRECFRCRLVERFRGNEHVGKLFLIDVNISVLGELTRTKTKVKPKIYLCTLSGVLLLVKRINTERRTKTKINTIPKSIFVYFQMYYFYKYIFLHIRI